MEEAGFKAFLDRRKLGSRSISSYLSNGRRVERLLDLDLHGCDLSRNGLFNIETALQQIRPMSGMTLPTLSNCMTAVRAYADFRTSSPAPAMRMITRYEAEPVPAPGQAVLHLLSRHETTMNALRAHGLLRTGSLVGDYAEWLFARAFGWALCPNSQAGHDATDGAGRRYQVKARRLRHPGASRQLGALRRLPERSFDVLAAVLFDAAFGVQRAILLPFDIVALRATPEPRTNSWRFMLNDVVWQIPGASDVTAELRAAAIAPAAETADPQAKLDAFCNRWQPSIAAMLARLNDGQNV